MPYTMTMLVHHDMRQQHAMMCQPTADVKRGLKFHTSPPPRVTHPFSTEEVLFYPRNEKLETTRSSWIKKLMSVLNQKNELVENNAHVKMRAETLETFFLHITKQLKYVNQNRTILRDKGTNVFTDMCQTTM